MSVMVDGSGPAAASLRRSASGRALGFARRRSTAVLADQVLSSGSNLALTVIVARQATAHHFAIFTLAFVAINFAMGSQRSFLGESLLIVANRSGAVTRECRRVAGASVLLAGVPAVAGAAVCAALGLYFATVAFAVAGVVLYQDLLRFCALADGDYPRLLALDGLWFPVLGVALVFGPSASSAAFSSYWLGAWALGALLGALAGVRRYAPDLRQAWAWLTRHRRLAFGLLFENTLISGSSQVQLLLLPVVAPLSIVATVRVGTTVANPALLVISALAISDLPRLAALAASSDGPGKVIERAGRQAMVFAGLAVGFAVVTLFVPDRLGTALFGPSWQHHGVVVPVFCLQTAVVAAFLPAVLAYRVCGLQRLNLQLRIAFTPLWLASALAAGRYWGADGVALASLAAVLLGAVTWWVVLLRKRTLRRPLGATSTAVAA